MTSSLVGSEMCIRDRMDPACVGSERQSCLVLVRQAASPLHGAMGSHSPVSYTHLTLPTICSV
eukprot:1785427-Prorocentrum_lima.AAC.1